MRHPYQCLATATLASPDSRQVLVAACGSQICIYDLQGATLLATWPGEDPKDEDEASNSSTEIITASNDPEHRPRKRRKTSAKQRGDALASPITNLIISQDSRHVIASTGEDKFIHVLEIAEDGKLKHLNQRRMTKRPCAIALTPKNDFILVGDKFGDVYALPLHFQYSDAAVLPTLPRSNGATSAAAPFKPSATNLTVHTERNLKALKNQMLHAQTKPSKVKDAMEFPHELLLGHVSMLTDLLSARVPSPKANCPDREYIITADRDEHIRVSRGHPQAHVIENYCFGHTQFVSKLCLAHPDILVSGGGDAQLLVWNWCKGELLGTLPILGAIQEYRKSETKDTSAEAIEDAGNEQIAVAGIWAEPLKEGEREITIWCICELIPAALEFAFELGSDGKFEQDSIRVKTHALPGNPIDMMFLQDHVVLSVDTVHEKGSMVIRESPSGNEEMQSSRLLSFARNAETSFQPLDVGGDIGEELFEDEQYKKVKDMLYGVGNLRKHINEDTEA